MDLLKVFPSLLLDLISKVIPGALFLAVFQNRYLPPHEIIASIFDPKSLSSEWQSWYKATVVLCTAYFIGVFIAILSNAIEIMLVKRLWYPRISKAPEQFIYVADQPPTMLAALKSANTFTLFLDHCRYFIYVNSPASAVMLEKYRTAFRMFFALSALSIAVPASAQTAQSMLALLGLVPLSFFALHTSKRYLCKSVQLYTLALGSKSESGKGK